MIELEQLVAPTEGERIGLSNGQLVVPNKPIIPVIEGDGIGRDIMKVTRRVVDAACSDRLTMAKSRSFGLMSMLAKTPWQSTMSGYHRIPSTRSNTSALP